MPRLSIDITREQHQKLKATAALNGQSIKDYVIERALGGSPDLAGMETSEALEALKAVLSPRIESAENGRLSERSVGEIAEQARGNLKA